MPDLPTLALAELHRRRENLARAVAAREITPPQADALAALWCGIAAWHGAQLPDELRPYEGWQLWIDHAPRTRTAAQWRTDLATEARRAWHVALKADPAGQSPRTRALREIAHPLCLAACIPLTEAEAEAEPAKEAA